MTYGFSKKIISSLVCQKDLTNLVIDSEINSNEEVIFEGFLLCPICKSRYEIKDGILNFLSSQKNLQKELLTEIGARNAEAVIYDKRMAIRYQKEIPSTLSKMGDIAGKKIIEYGCGSGRFTVEIFNKCEGVLAIDFSRESLYLLSKKLENCKNIGLVLADAIQIKTTPLCFDLAFSAQLLEHIPNTNQRSAFLKNISNTLKKEGIIICSVYHYDLRSRIKKQPQEGHHSSGIFYHYFKRKEIENEFGRYFKSMKFYFIDITLPLEGRLGLGLIFSGRLSRFFESIPIINKFAHLLLVRAQK